jgi:hypothetical protein
MHGATLTQRAPAHVKDGAAGTLINREAAQFKRSWCSCGRAGGNQPIDASLRGVTHYAAARLDRRHSVVSQL